MQHLLTHLEKLLNNEMQPTKNWIQIKNSAKQSWGMTDTEVRKTFI